MGPKKKIPRGKKGKARDAKKSEISAAPFVSEREKYLQKEYTILTEHIHTYTQRVRHFQWENQFLDKEAQQIRDISKAYLSYLLKRALRCQNAIISLNDQNRSDLAQIRKQKADLAAQYVTQEDGLKSQLILLETKLSLLNREVEAMQPWKDLQCQQLTRIRELEKELLVMKVQHMEQMHRVKSQFLQQKAEYEMESQQKIQALAKLAEKEAVRGLILHTKQVKAEYWRLRNELLNLIRQAQELKAFLLQLRSQQQQLLREHCYSEDLARMRRWLRHHKAQLLIPPVGSFRCSPSSKSRLISPQPTSSQLPEGKEDPGSHTSGQQADKALPLAGTPTVPTRGEPPGHAQSA